MRVRSNKVYDILDFAQQELNEIYSTNEINSLMAIVFFHFMKWDKPQLLLNKKETLNESDLLKVYFAIKGLKNNQPIQYICKETTFCDCQLSLNEHTLIPRPETEELVELIAQNMPTPNACVLDIGTGSGAIAIALAKKFPNSTIEACDFSEKALYVAKDNAAQNKVNIRFFECDILAANNQKSTKKYDVIVSNPPYVCESEKSLMHKNVLEYEPHSALFVSDEKPLLFYQAIFKYAVQNLAPEGMVCFEINERFGQEMLNLANRMGFAGKLFQDINEKDRFVIAQRIH